MPSINSRWNFLCKKKSILKILGENDINIKFRKKWGVVQLWFLMGGELCCLGRNLVLWNTTVSGMITHSMFGKWWTVLFWQETCPLGQYGRGYDHSFCVWWVVNCAVFVGIFWGVLCIKLDESVHLWETSMFFFSCHSGEKIQHLNFKYYFDWKLYFCFLGCFRY